MGGTALGLALGAAQWMPGLEFLSQIPALGAPPTRYFTSEPLPARLITLLASPFILGSNQTYPGPYVGPYNFPEVTSYMGILALIGGLLALPPEVPHPARGPPLVGLVRHRRRWACCRHSEARRPSGMSSSSFPGLNSERLLNRNLLLVDFALAVLVAWWVHVLLDTAGRDTDRPRRVASIRHRWRGGGSGRDRRSPALPSP